MDHTEFDELHTSCIDALRAYFAEAETSSQMLANCKAEPLPLKERMALLSQELIEHDAHLTYLGTKRLLHDAALYGYGSRD
jgi:hypothetical protein